MERMFLHSWYHVQRRREADVLLIAHAQVWPWAFTFLCDMYMSGFFACASFRGHKQRSIWIFHPPSPHNGTPFLSVPTTDVSLHITSLLPPYSWSFCFHGIKKWRHQRLMYSLCIPPLLRKSHKMSLFGSVNVWEAALYFRLWWNLEHSEVGVLWWSHASRLRWLFESRLASSICRWCCGGRPCFCVGKTDPIQTSFLHVQA